MASSDRPSESPSTRKPSLPSVAPTVRAPAWELVETGRYRPRRIRGSFPGRELG